MKKIFFILTVFLVLLAGSVSVYAMGSPQSTNPNGPNYVPPPASQNGQPASGSPATNTCDNVKGCPPSSAAAAKMTFPSMFSVPKWNGLEIQKVPEDIIDNSSLEGWLFNLGVSLAIFGFVYNLYMTLYRLSVGAESRNKTYWQ